LTVGVNYTTPRTSHLGVLVSPFMRAALVIDVDPLAVTVPLVRPARF
jgi:hypothetical protein